ncbi:hypothetical protein HY570_03805, partial [Candidatus Micrarchaeota archaeon]|nr:hypothetical protein [Candidatus Micrarchaeota archaeon]
MSVQFSSEKEDSYYDFQESFTVTIYPNKSFEDVETIEKDFLLSTDRITNKKSIKFKGYSAQLIELEDPVSQLLIKIIYIKQDTILYRLETIVEKSQKSKYETILEEMFNSFEIGKTTQTKTSPFNYKTYS